MPEPNRIEGETCPFCNSKTLTLMEEEIEVPYFGNVFVFSMSCSSCKYHKADVEAEEQKPPVKFTLDITDAKDMDIRVVKSSEATVKIPRIASIEPGPASEGYITNVEGIFQRIKDQLEHIKNNDDDEEAQENARKMIKKINRIVVGQDPAKLVIEDPSGNSAIISDKAVKGKL
ncbi:TPA: ZPR1 zinc finger domain-containing protein [Candidatus Woesearchaeota archaeon]|nr:ZPR1 zinc finger domain-containing protein [Candidatus Woesearchaeota archaeon]